MFLKKGQNENVNSNSETPKVQNNIKDIQNNTKD